MSELRWVLLLIGVAIIVGTLIYAQLSQRKQERELFTNKASDDALLADSEHYADLDSEREPFGSVSEYSADAFDNDIHSGDQSKQTPTFVDSNTNDTDLNLAEDNAEETAEEKKQHIVVLHVMSRSVSFNALDLKNQLEHLGLRHGNFDFYHRESLQNPDISLFSVANMFKPGTFDPDNIDTYQTRGISFFMVLPGPPDAITTFNEMLQTAKQCASKLEGDLYDADRSSFTGQRAQFIRDEIVNFMHQLKQH